jgi:predicted N-acetyltransferase YhbS
MNNLQSQDFTIVAAAPAHAAEIAEITRGAFTERYGTGDSEVWLVRALRADGDVVVERVALRDERVVGHVMFSRAAVTPAVCRVAALAPVSARIGCQGRGIGNALIRKGLAACAAQGIEAVIVLGDPAYYGRFGFRADLARPLACRYAGPHFQALELRPGALQGVSAVAYASAFQSPG